VYQSLEEGYNLGSRRSSLKKPSGNWYVFMLLTSKMNLGCIKVMLTVYIRVGFGLLAQTCHDSGFFLTAYGLGATNLSKVLSFSLRTSGLS
jgi:hypothetical protein